MDELARGGLTRRQEYAEATRNAIVGAAEELYATAGTTEVGVSEIATRARVSKGTVYHHFSDKAALFVAVYRRQLTWLAADLAAAVAQHQDPWRQLGAAVGAYLEGGGGEGPVAVLAAASPGILGAGRSRALEEELVLPWLSLPLARLARAKELIPGDPEVMGRLVLGALREAAALSAPGEGPAQGAMAAKVVQAMLGGLRRKRYPRS